MSSGRRYEVAAAGLLMLAATGYFAAASVGSYARQWQAHSSFVPVSATVVAASVESTGSAVTTHGASFRPRVLYRYAVGGVEHQSDRYFFIGGGWPDRASAEAAIVGLAPGTPIQAFVDAAAPTRAVLDRRKPEVGFLAYLLPLGLLGLGAVVYGLRRRG